VLALPSFPSTFSQLSKIPSHVPPRFLSAVSTSFYFYSVFVLSLELAPVSATTFGLVAGYRYLSGSPFGLVAFVSFHHGTPVCGRYHFPSYRFLPKRFLYNSVGLSWLCSEVLKFAIRTSRFPVTPFRGPPRVTADSHRALQQIMGIVPRRFSINSLLLLLLLFALPSQVLTHSRCRPDISEIPALVLVTPALLRTGQSRSPTSQSSISPLFVIENGSASALLKAPPSISTPLVLLFLIKFDEHASRALR